MRYRGLASVGCVVIASSLQAQSAFRWPDNPRNLKVLADSVRGQRLGDVMRGFSMALGVDCAHCHVGEGDLAAFDFASDEKATKNTARAMIRMVRSINGSHLAALAIPAASRVAVTCVTCHRGAPRPQMLEDVLEAVIDSAGIQAGLARYQELRKEFYGTFTYDFSRGPLATLGERLARAQKFADAIRVFQLELVTNGDDIRTLMSLGSVQVQAGEKSAAHRTFEKALALAPASLRPQLQQQIDRVLKP